MEEETFYEDIKHNPKPEIATDISNGKVFPYPKGELLKKLQNIDSMSEKDAYNLVSDEFYSILSDIFKRNSKDYLFLLKSPKFLTIMIQVVNTHTIEYDEVVHCNSFIYNFLLYMSQTGNEDSYIKKLLFMLGEALNKTNTRRLMGCELSEQLSIFLSVSLMSSFEPAINIRRLNFALCTACPSVINAKKAIQIYEALFDKVRDLIVYTLFDRAIVDSADDDWVTEDVYKADQMLTYATMIILESMVPIEITHVLISIAEEYKWKNYSNSICKISFHSLNKSIFIKTNVIVEQLEGDGYIFP